MLAVDFVLLAVAGSTVTSPIGSSAEKQDSRLHVPIDHRSVPISLLLTLLSRDGGARDHAYTATFKTFRTRARRGGDRLLRVGMGGAASGKRPMCDSDAR